MREDPGGKRLRPKKKDPRQTGLHRRMLLAALFLCVGVLASLSLGALAQQPQPSPPSVESPPPSLAPRESAPDPSPPGEAAGTPAVPAAQEGSPSPEPSSAPPSEAVPEAPASPSPQVPEPVAAAGPTPAPVQTPEPSPVLPVQTLPPAAAGDGGEEAAPFDFSQPAPETAAVEDSWFSDAVFLGDSRTDGLRLYSGIWGADFLAYKSQMVFHVTGGGSVQARAIPKNGTGEKKTTYAWLEEKQYGAVYVMFGINELGYNIDTVFTDAFRQLIAGIRARQPEAVIYIQSLVPIEPEKAHKTNPAWWLNNDRVASCNALLRQVCAEEGAVYLDVQAALVDSSGALPSEGTADGIHFTKPWYQKWYAYLKTHTVDPDAYAAGLAALEAGEEEVPS